MLRGAGQVGVALARRPDLWATALHQARVLSVPGWWRSWRPLPLPDPAYLRFRLSTAYGEAGGPVRADDVVSYLAWCRTERAATTAAAGGAGRATLRR